MAVLVVPALDRLLGQDTGALQTLVTEWRHLGPPAGARATSSLRRKGDDRAGDSRAEDEDAGRQALWTLEDSSAVETSEAITRCALEDAEPPKPGSTGRGRSRRSPRSE